MQHKLSIIIPILNEEAYIGRLLGHLERNSSKKNMLEIIVVDGGSTDKSQNIVSNLKRTMPYLRLLNSEKGRAKQMNHAAIHASGDILYFLHADSFPPKDFDLLIINNIKEGHFAGCFRMQFDSKHWWLKLASWLTQFRWRVCRGGDQSQFITKSLFNEIGGYNENYIIYEDNMLINELYVRKQFVVINEKLTSSARLYRKHGVWKLQYHYWTIYMKKWFGGSAEELYRYYKKYIC